jgi:3',5'-nucleoside bisphosphate phosphatase
MDKVSQFRYSYLHPKADPAGISEDIVILHRSAPKSIIGDLHMHSSYSDGIYSPRELVQKAGKNGLGAISITDHDSVNGIDEAIEAGSLLNIKVIAGIELSAMCENREVHILGYFIDHHNTDLEEYLKFFRAQRVKRAREMVTRLNNLNIPVKIDSIIENAEGRSIGRPHIAAEVLKTGSVKTYLEVFHKYIGYGCPAFVEKYHLDVADAIAMITKAGGLSFIAHPSVALNDSILLHIIKTGIDGIETVHPSLTNQQSTYYRGIAEEYYLLQSGGSDFHGGKRDDEAYLGRYGVPLNYIDAMQKRLVA